MTLLLKGIFTGRALHSDSPFVAEHRDELAELCQRHGEDSVHVSSIEYVTTPARWLVFTVYVTGPGGGRYLACGCGGRFQTRSEDGTLETFHEGDCRVADTVRAHRLIGELPAWWKPARKSKQRRH